MQAGFDVRLFVIAVCVGDYQWGVRAFPHACCYALACRSCLLPNEPCWRNV